MPDAIQTLSTTLQAQIAGSGATAATILALSSAIVSGSQTMAAARQSRRVGLLNAVLIPALLPVNTRVGDIASAWNECSEANQFLAAAVNFDTELNVLRVHGSTGAPLAGVIANIPFANYASWGAALVTSAGVYEGLLAETLPA
jgi:hypothetical protein